jgi:sulfonate transport system substrate-binding protein
LVIKRAEIAPFLRLRDWPKIFLTRSKWSEFPAAAPILEALNAGALDVGYTGDLAFLTVYAAGAPIKAIGGTRADARTQAILVRKDSPIKSAADLKGKRLAGTRGGMGTVSDRRDTGKGRA